MMGDAVATPVEPAHPHADCFQVSLGQGVGGVMQDCPVQRQMPFQRVRAQAMHGDDVVEPTVGYQQTLVLRSEEHTSDLQSLMRLSYAVFCLKKTNNNNNTQRYLD